MKNQSLNALTHSVSKLAACFIVGFATLSQTGRSAPSYATAALSDNPVAFWQLTETNNPSTGTLPASDSSGNGHNGTYGTTSLNGFNGIVGPQPPTYQGFTNGQGALECVASDANSPVTVPALNLNTNAVTIAMWINPYSAETTYTGLLMNRDSAGDAAGFGFGGNTDANGMAELGYTWNTNSGATWGFHSGLYPIAGTWQFAVLVIQSNSATFYLDYIDPNTGQTNLFSAVNSIAHTPQAFSQGATFIGSDVVNGATPDSGRVFAGSIAGVAVYHSALSSDQVLALFAGGVGVNGFAPSIGGQPRSQYVLSGSPVQLRGTANGTSPLAYQWQLNGTNVNLLADSANFTGANSNVLTILSVTAADAGSYQLMVTNLYGTAFSSNAVVTIQSPGLVGEWLTNNTLADVSGYAPAGTHDGYDISGTGSFAFTNDVPPGQTGQSLLLYNGDTGIAISNSSTLDTSYTNTFDERINNAMTVAVWAKGWPTGGWNPFVSKYGESGQGWQLRRNGGPNPTWTIRGTGTAEDMSANRIALNGDTNDWHFYVGTLDVATGVRSLYVDGQLAAQETNNSAYTLAPLSHLVIGARDTNGVVDSSTFFTGQIYDARVYNYALTSSDVLALYGVVPPTVAMQPNSLSVFEGVSAQLSTFVSGTPPLAYQWQLNGTNVNLLPDSANFTGANSNVLTILGMARSDVGSYQLIVTNNYGTAVSSNALISIVPKILVGEWFTNGTLTDLSGFTPAGTHDAYAVGAGSYTFVDDVPPGETGQSIQFGSGADSGMAIANSATSDSAYTNTFDTSALSVAFWAKDRGPFGGNWHAWVAKDGYNNDGEYNGLGWSVGIEAWSQYLYFDMEGIDHGGINYTLGDGLWGNTILECNPKAIPTDNTTWHHYAITYNPATGVRRTYFDGIVVAEQTGNAAYAKAPDKHLTIGAQEQTTAGFTGFNRTTMYDVRFYNYELTSNQVMAILPDPVISVQPPQTLNAYIGNVARISATVMTHSTPAAIQWQHDGTNLVDGAFGDAIISGANSSALAIGNVTTNVQGVYRLMVTDPNGTVISSNTTVTVLPTAPPPAGNLVGAWLTGAASLDDASGYTPGGVHDGYGVAGTGTPSSNYGFTNDVPSGWTGQSLVLPGTAAIAISNSSSLDAAYTNTFDDTITNMTVAFWAKGWPSGGWNPFVSKYGESGQGWQLRRNGGANPTWTVRGTGANEDMSANIAMSSDGLWHHFAGTFTFDGTTGERNLYVDGVLVASETESAPYVLAASSYLCIGGRDSGGNAFGNYFTGDIYDVKIYSVALTEAQVNSLAYSTLPPSAPVLPVLPVPVLYGNNLVLTWTNGTLLQATNVTGPWTSTGATSPYTNDITTAPQMFFRLSNP